VGEGAIAGQGAAMAARRGGVGRERGRDKDGEDEARDKIFFGCGSEQSEASIRLDVLIVSLSYNLEWRE
jgi:hypothetical protein